MSENNRIRVIGYEQRVFFNDGIEYRNFSDGLVGNQQTEGSTSNSSVFTLGNFVTTTNYEGRTSRIFSTKKFSKFYNLENYNLTSEGNKLLLNNNVTVTLNLDTSDLCNFAYFGSATEFVRVSLENIITNWPASLYLNPLRNDGINTVVGDTVTDYSYNPVLNKATFKVDVNFISNKFDINFLQNGTIVDTFNQDNTLRNLTVSFANYVVLIEGNEYPVLNFTGSTSVTNDFVYFEVKGDPFGFNGTAASKPEYHIKPNRTFEESFFNSISEYENNLLNRLTVPKYTSKYKFKTELDDGNILINEKTLTWPVNDGYNIDYDTPEYVSFVTDLLEISNSKDGIETNLMTRFLTAQSISDFDTVPKCDGTEEETAGQKMNRTLKIYGREFDEIKKYIDGISFANVVTYDKKENTPDQLVKYLARVLGWELTSSILENDLVNSYLNVGTRSYAGYSRGLTPAEAEIELWRRLILNSSWIWKAKGTRKTIEFFFKMIGAPDGLIDFDEHVYVAKNPIDMDLFYAVLENNGLDNDLSLYNVDDEGYPKFFRDTSDMYFQKGGQWYRETSGPGAIQHVLEGNNPHVGPYDGGKEYINQLENIIPAFTAFTLTSTTITTGTTQLFTNYNNGIVNQYTGDTYITLQNDDNVDLTGKVNATTSIIDDPCPQIELTDCGCDIPEDDEALKIYIDKEDFTPIQVASQCNDGLVSTTTTTDNYIEAKYTLYDVNGNPSTTNYKITKFINPECCSTFRAKPFYYEEYTNVSTDDTIVWELVNCGYICGISDTTNTDQGKAGVGSKLSCQWLLSGPTLGDMELIGSDYYLKFIDPKGDFRLVNESDSGFCPVGNTVGTVITDPYNGKVGYACRLTSEGINVLSNDPSESNELYQLYKERATNVIGCKSDVISTSTQP